MTPSISTAYVYDAVLTYAKALSFLIKGRNLPSEQIAKLAQDGRLILATIIAMQNFSSKSKRCLVVSTVLT